MRVERSRSRHSVGSGETTPGAGFSEEDEGDDFFLEAAHSRPSFVEAEVASKPRGLHTVTCFRGRWPSVRFCPSRSNLLQASDTSQVRIQWVHVVRKGDALTGENTFEHTGGVLIRLVEKPLNYPIMGKPGVPALTRARTITDLKWKQQAGFFAFLRLIDVVQADSIITPDLLLQCGVISIPDDGLCGFACIAYLMGFNFNDMLAAVRGAMSQDVAIEKRLWHLADALIQEGREDPTALSRNLQARGVNASLGGEYRLGDDELCLLCEKLNLQAPLVQVSEDYDFMRLCDDFTSLAEVARGSVAWADHCAGMEDGPEGMRVAGKHLNALGFELVVVRVQNRGKILAVNELGDTARMIIALGDHFFVLDRTNSPSFCTQDFVKSSPKSHRLRNEFNSLAAVAVSVVG